jgi:hypothetical protein
MTQTEGGGVTRNPHPPGAVIILLAITTHIQYWNPYSVYTAPQKQKACAHAQPSQGVGEQDQTPPPIPGEVMPCYVTHNRPRAKLEYLPTSPT